jgi:hypothetical protein
VAVEGPLGRVWEGMAVPLPMRVSVNWWLG